LLSAKIAYRNLPKRRARTALTILAVILGVALLVGINLATASATGEFTNYINKFWGRTDIVVSYGELPPVFDSRYLPIVKNTSGVQETAARLVWFGFGPPANKTRFQLVGVNGTDFDYSSFNITGAKTLSPGQATVDDGLAQNFGLRIGSTLNVFTPNFIANTTITIPLSVVGINHPLRNIGASIYINLDQLQRELSFRGMISHIYATLKDPTRAPQVRDEIQNRLGSPLSRASTAVAENIPQIPSLPPVQLTPTIPLMGLGAGFAAVFAGSLYPAASASRINIIQAIRPSARNSRKRIPDSIIVLLSLGMITVGSLEAARLTPFHVSYLDVALIPMGLVILGAVVFGRSGRILSAPLLPFSRAVGYIASRNGRRRLLRNAISFGMITITLSFVIMLGGIQGGVQTALDQGIQEALGADIILVANQSLPISFTNNLTSFSQVSLATPLGPSLLPFNPKALGPKGNSTSVGVLAVDPTTFPQIINYQFVNSPPQQQVYAELANNSRTVLLPDSLASRLDVSVGESVDITTFNGTLPFHVAGAFTGPVLQYIQFGNSFASDSIVVSFNSQKEFFC